MGGIRSILADTLGVMVHTQGVGCSIVAVECGVGEGPSRRVESGLCRRLSQDHQCVDEEEN